MRDFGFLTRHAQALLFLARVPDARLKDIGDEVGTTERTAHEIVTDLVEAGYLVKEKDGRRNRYHLQEHLPLRDAVPRERTIGEVLDLFGVFEPSGRRRRR
jgi:DNA-binding IclR family transcriptional regulator